MALATSPSDRNVRPVGRIGITEAVFRDSDFYKSGKFASEFVQVSDEIAMIDPVPSKGRKFFAAAGSSGWLR
jgi:hypothetical protein